MLEMETFIRRKVTYKTGGDAWLKTTYKSAVAANAKRREGGGGEIRKTGLLIARS